MLHARSDAEARLYIEHAGWVVLERRPQADGTVLFRCADARDASPKEVAMRVDTRPKGAWGFGGAEPSRILDAAAFRGLAIRLEARTPRSAAGLVQPAVRECFDEVGVAHAAWEEVLKFGPDPDAAARMAALRERAAGYQGHIPFAPPVRALDQMSLPSHGYEPRTYELARATLAGEMGRWEVVAPRPEGRFLWRHPDGAVMEARREGERFRGLRWVKGRDALGLLLTHAYALPFQDQRRIESIVAAGRPVEEAVGDAVLPPDEAKFLVLVAGADEALWFWRVDTHRAAWRTAVLLVIADPEDRVRGVRFLEGLTGFEQLEILQSVAPYLPATDSARPPAAIATEMAANLAIIEREVRAVLARFEDPRSDGDPSELRPRSGDVAQVFRGPVDEIARRYEAVWQRPPAIVRRPGESVLDVALCTGGGFTTLNHLSTRFSPGWVGVAPFLQESRTWATWTWHPPGGPGSRYDGLVWVRDHWAWFPAPDRVLAGL